MHIPFRDRVTGEIPQMLATVACFARSLSQVSASLKQNMAMVKVIIKIRELCWKPSHLYSNSLLEPYLE